MQELSQRLRTATDELTGRLGRPPIVAELARHLGVGEEEVLDARAALAAHSPPSLDEPISDDSEPVTLGDLLSGGDGGIERAEHAVLVEHYLAQLPSCDRQVLRLRFQQDLTQREIGALLGVSQIARSRLIRHWLKRLQPAATEESMRRWPAERRRPPTTAADGTAGRHDPAPLPGA